MALIIASSAFSMEGHIPSRFTCDGANVSPPLSWQGIPVACKSLVLIVDDPDAPDPAAPKRTWVHWLLYNIPPFTEGLYEGAGAGQLPVGTLEGLNDWQRNGYGGPCPPIGRHRYYFKLYALDCLLPDLQNPPKAKLEKAIVGHILEEAVLMGSYQRTGR